MLPQQDITNNLYNKYTLLPYLQTNVYPKIVMGA
jgi:hypothetical protein